MTPDEYIARAANARPVYVELFQTAVTLLPPQQGSFNIECHYTARDLTHRFDGRTMSVIRNELKLLVNWRWIVKRPGNIWYMGRKIGLDFFLQADVAAQAITDEERLVSRRILGITLEAPPVTDEMAARGGNRRWTGDTTTQDGGTLDEILGA